MTGSLRSRERSQQDWQPARSRSPRAQGARARRPPLLSSRCSPYYHTTYYDDTTSQYVVEIQYHLPIQETVPLNMQDGTTVAAQSNKPYLGEYAAVCTFRFDNGGIVWRVWDYSASSTESSAARAECDAIGQIQNSPGP